MIPQIQNRETFKAIFDEYYSALCNFIYRYVRDRDACEDIVQSVFIRLWENREEIKLTGNVKSYLFTASKNGAIDYIRKQKRETEYKDANPGDELFAEIEIGDVADREILREKIHLAIQSLKPKTREIFVLHKIEGLTYPEIAEYLGIPKRTVEYNLYTALAQLKEMLKDEVDY